MEEEKTVESQTGNKRPKKRPRKIYDPKKYKGKKLLIRFTHTEFPKASLQFTYRGITYEMKDQEEIMLPLEVVEHLNSLAVPESKYEEDPTTGQLKQGPVTLRHRFSCIPLNLAQFATKEEK